jgi:UTP--glucose-1-phosphate uridylyltransferase
MAQEPCLKQMMDAYSAVGGNMAAVMDVPREETQRYGILDVVGKEGKLTAAKGLVEKPAPEAAPSTLSIIGRYILDPSVFAELDRQEAGAGGEIQLTDAMARTIGRVPFHGLRFDGRRFDCGSKAGFLEANIAFALARDDMRRDTTDIVRRYAQAAEAGTDPTNA